jgi:TonB family protein
MLNLLRNGLALYGAYTLYRKFSRPGRDSKPGVDGVYRIVEEMPLYGLDASAYPLPEYQDAKQAADRRMLEFIHSNISYPKQAHREGVEGTAVVSFVVRPDGKADTLKLVRDPGSELGRAAMDVARKLLDEGEGWRPGYQRGRKVPVQFNLPIKFKATKFEADPLKGDPTGPTPA